MQIPALTSAPLWLSEHYWPELTDGLVITQAQRTAMVGHPVRWLATLIVPGEGTAFGLFTGPTAHDVEQALRAAGPAADRVSAALRVTRPTAHLPGGPTHDNDPVSFRRHH